MHRTLARGLAVAIAAALLALVPAAHNRLRTSSGAPLFWSTPANVGITINSAGSDDISDGSHETAIRLAIRAWNDATGTSARLVENTSPARQARTDFNANDIHLVLFDEVNASGFFSNPGTVAVTPVWFFGSGQITDADVLFNGLNHQFTTEVPGPPGHFDVGDVATHELGHLLGLDHSAHVGATMYPYVDPIVILHRSPSRDDVNGLREAYPAGASATLRGTIVRASDSSPVAGAHVFARDALGKTVGATLSATNGAFAIRGLDAGLYDVAAAPLEGAVTAANLGFGYTIQTDFEAAETGGTFVVNAGQTVSIGTLQVGHDVAISLGRQGDPYPLRCVKGTTVVAFDVVHGVALAAGSTLSTPDPFLTIHSAVLSGGTRVDFAVDVDPGAEIGHSDLRIEDPLGNVSILPGVFEVTGADPVVTGVAPAVGPDFGGTAVTLTGSGFEPGARVVLGPNVYVDGDPGGCTVVDANTITLTTASMPAGTYDAVVIDATGVEGRSINSFSASDSIPDPQWAFPEVGSAVGGTEVVISGQNFQDAPGFRVEINGVVQTGVTVVDPTTILLTTEPGIAGGPYDLDVYNPSGEFATLSFTYVSTPDPGFSSVTPAAGSVLGGDTIRVSGTSFVPGMEVFFGEGGDPGDYDPAAVVTYVDANTIDVLTPAVATSGTKNMVIANPSMQADLAVAAFTFVAPSSGDGGGGGGGCSVGAPPTSSDPWLPLTGSGWFLLALVAVWLRALALRRRALRVRA